MSSPTQADRSEQSAEQRRRKRKERAAKSRAPEPRNIVSGAGLPLDPGVRRELEERLGHDLGRVRLHTGRDAGQLTELLGADAVAVGQDVFFREGAYKPGTDEGRRLLAHELLHTVQNPHGLGALRVGRELGAVSLPQQAIEREAESAAQDLVRDPEARPGTPEVEEGQATPGWLRYATVDADRMRAEAVDPATLVDRLAGGVLRSLRGDPADLSGRVRMQLARMSPQVQDAVLDQLEVRLLTPEYDRLLELADQAEERAPELQPAEAPEAEGDLFELLGVERTRWKREQEGERGAQDRRAADEREEQQDARARDEKHNSERSRAQADAVVEDQEAARRNEQEDERRQSREQAQQEQRQESEKQSADRARVDEAADERAQEQRDGTEQAKEERKAQRDREEQDPEQASAPGAGKRRRRDQATQPAAGARRAEVDPKAKGQPGPVRPEKVDERAEQRDSALSEHGLDEKAEDEEELREEERPLGLEAGADREIGTGQEQSGKGPSAPRTPEIKPEDHLPETDVDLSAVPTADQLVPGAAEPALPVFPTTPPPTKAERIEREREKQEQAEDSAEPEAKAPGQDEGPVEGEAPQPEGGPVARAGDRGEKDLQPDKPTDQEVGPDPETTDKERQEPEPEQRDAVRQQEQQQERDDETAAEDREAARGEEGRDTEDTREEGRQEQERTRQETRTDGTPGGGSAAEATSAAMPAAPALARPAGAHTPSTPVEDRNPSPAVRRDAEPPKPQREAPAAKSAVPKESGPGAAPRGAVGASERVGPTTGAGPGAAPSAAQAAVSPAGEQAENPGKLGAPAPEGAQPKPEASLEKDGGGCAPPEPAPEKDDGATGSCGGGGGGQAAEEKQQEPPDVSGQDPKAAVQTVSKLAPDQAAAAMPGVDGAVDKKVGEEQQRLAADPPTRERPSGAPRTRSAPPEAAPPAAQVTGKVERVEPAEQGDKQQAKGGEKAEGHKPTQNVPPPPPPVAAELNAEEAQNVEAAADAVPTVDPALRNKTVGPAPKIRLEGASDPTRTDEQAKALKEKQNDIHRAGREDAAKPMGEDQIFPNAPQEQLVGKAAAGGGGKGGQLAPSPAPKAGVGAVAKQEKGSEIESAAGQAQGELTAREKEHQQGEQQAKREKQAEIDREVARNTEQQTAERGRVAQEVQQQREQWRTEQDRKIEDADAKSAQEHTTRNQEIVKARDDKDKEIQDRKEQDNQKIDAEREKSEREAEKKKEEQKPSGGFFGWLADKVKSFFSALLEAVTAVFEAARKVVNGIIDTFKEWADKAIDFVRDLAIKAINLLADALIAIGDVLLAAFPELRDRFRKAIEGLRDAAIATVNKLADGLKNAVNALLDALAAGLNKLLDVLEAGLKAVIKAYQAVILGAIKFAQAAIEALGKFAALVADIAPDPGGWLAKAGSSAKAGITDHLWGAIKVAVKQWFDTKVEGILGLGKAVVNVLVKGCVSIKQIGKMAWDAIVASLPVMIASLVIEKVVSMLVPAAGAILTIVQGLMAAWQSLSSILSAFSKFWAYLKAVKAGPAACLFAEAVAAGVVALLDFIANFLMIRLTSATKGVGKRLKAMAQKITEGLKKTGRGAKQAAGAAVNKARGAMRNAQQKLRQPAAAPRPKAEPSPAGQAPVKPKNHATPKSAAKPDLSMTRPKDTPGRPDADRTPDRPQDRAPDRSRGRDGAQDSDRSQDRDVPRDKDSTPGTTPKKKREIEGPKPAKPKKPTSPAGKALSKAKGAVKSALTKVRNAARTLGKKLRNSRPGKALTNSASKLRDLFKKKRDRLRDDRRRQQEQKRQDQARRRKDEKSRESKEARLQKIVARVRPRVTALLKRGVGDRALQGSLSAMRLWYRLTELARAGADRFRIDARLNPQVQVQDGVQVDRDRLLIELRRISEDIVKENATKGTAGRIRETAPTLGSRDEQGNAREIPTYSIPTRVRMPAVLAFARRMKFEGPGKKEILSFEDQPAPMESNGTVTGVSFEPTGVARQQGAFGKSLTNKIVKMLRGGKEVRDQLDYETIGKAVQASGQGPLVARDVIKYLRGKRANRENSELASFLAVLTAVQEGHRNVSAVATAAMTFESARAGRNFEEALTEMPMALTREEYTNRRGRQAFRGGAVPAANQLNRYLQGAERGRGTEAGPRGRFGREMMEREIRAIQQWIQYTGDLNVDTEQDAQKIEQQVFAQIRARIRRVYGMS